MIPEMSYNTGRQIALVNVRHRKVSFKQACI